MEQKKEVNMSNDGRRPGQDDSQKIEKEHIEERVDYSEPEVGHNDEPETDMPEPDPEE